MKETIILPKKAKEKLNVLLKEQKVEKIFYKNIDDMFHSFIIQYEDSCTLFKTYFFEEDADFFWINKEVSEEFLDFKSFKKISKSNIKWDKMFKDVRKMIDNYNLKINDSDILIKDYELKIKECGKDNINYIMFYSNLKQQEMKKQTLIQVIKDLESLIINHEK